MKALKSKRKAKSKGIFNNTDRIVKDFFDAIDTILKDYKPEHKSKNHETRI